MGSIVVELLLSRIASALDSEARLIAGVGDELSSLQQELLWMKSFLEDVYRRNTSLTETQRRWVDEVTGMAYIAEDIIDHFMYHMSSQPNGPKFTRLFYATIRFPQNLWKRRQIAKELQKMKRKITDARERNELYLEDRSEGITSLQLQLEQQKQLQNYSESSLFFKNEDLVGTEYGQDKLVGWLTDAEPQRTVISVVGIGGSGKTTLVASVYNHRKVRRHFDCWAWITVSQTFDAHDLLKTMIKDLYRTANQEVPTDLSTMTYRELVDKLVEYLRPKRYVIVLDDVWTVNLWTQLSISLPDEVLGSRVLITTRKQDVASSSFGVRSHVHLVEPLEKSRAWELFCMKAFSNVPNKTCPQALQTIALDCVAKCQGLPLAIVALGGLMASKNLEYSRWKQVLDGFTWELGNNPTLERVKIVLMLSFHDLSYRLKCCFLYCCLFPEDYKIDQEKLKKLWMAEGFVEKVRGIRPEDTAHSYFLELVDRNMLQRPIMAGYCNMHDILREFALDISIKEKFCTTYNGRNAIHEEINGARRLSIQSTERELRCWNMSMMQLRTLFVFPKDVETLPHGLKLLRVLDLEHVPIVKLPDELVDLFNLRYLNLSDTRVKELPKSIGRLRNLQTLYTMDSNIRVLPDGITKLHNLRHLNVYDIDKDEFEDFNYGDAVAAPANICKLKELQILEGVEANVGLMKQARNMTQLRRLAIYNVRETSQQDLINSIQSMKLLTHLLVKLDDEEEYLRMDTLSSAPPCLRWLKLVGKLERSPSWFSSLERLTWLVLNWSRLREDPLPYIHALSNLKVLILNNAYAGRQLCFSTGFSKLKGLGLNNMAELNEIIIEKGVMPNVTEMWLKGCMELKMLPHGIQFLTNLQALRLTEVSNELIQGIEREGTLDRRNVQHIPHITYYDRVVGHRKIVLTDNMKK